MTDQAHNWQQVKAEALRTAAAIILPVEFSFTANGTPFHARMDGNLRFTPMGIDGLSAVNIYAPDGHAVMLVRGLQGAHSTRVVVPMEVTVNVLEGSLLYFVEGKEPVLVEAWQPGLPEDCSVIKLGAGVAHGFVVIKPCLNYDILTPVGDEQLTLDPALIRE